MSISKKTTFQVYPMHPNDTIAAISTSIGEAGIGIVRMSGQDALRIADEVFLAKDGRKPPHFKTYTLHYGWIVAQPAKERGPSAGVVDEVVLTVMRAPKSYTREDVVEINCHGGIAALRKVLDLVLGRGCRLAEPGEFTKRAFLNGRIDLAQAEAVIDIIRAKSDAAFKIGAEQLRGVLSTMIQGMRGALLATLAQLEAQIDFPEEEIGPADKERITQDLQRLNCSLKALIESSRYGRLVREGIHVVICGSPNVGKSSLLNALLRQERSIVTAVPGTTRDTIEEIIDIRGIPIRIVDTAGILGPRDLIEKEAVARSKRQIDLADLVILLFDGSRALTRQDKMLASRLKNRPVLAVVNKIDKKQRIEKSAVPKYCKSTVLISAKKNRNIDLLEDAIARLVYGGEVSSAASVLAANVRQTQLIKKAQKLIAEAIDSVDNKLSLEFVAQGARDALACLDELVGARFSEEVLDRIFSEFCIGK